MLLWLLQLAGTAVFAIGLWLRLDPKTKGLFEGPDAPYVFYTGKMVPPIQQLSSWLKFKGCAFPGPVLMCVFVFRCVHTDRGWSTDDGGGLPGMLRGNPGVPLYAGAGSYPV